MRWRRVEDTGGGGEVPPIETVALLDDAIAKWASAPSMVRREDVVDAFLDLRLSIITSAAIERLVAGVGDAPAPPPREDIHAS